MDSFSIIIPTYRRPASALACLESLLDLDYPRELLEVILVEDGAADRPLLAEDLERFVAPLRLQVIRQGNAGPAAARNRGAAVAQGDFLAFTDDDCRPRPDWIKTLALQFVKTPNHVIGGQTENALPDRVCSEASQVLLDYIYEYFLKHGCPLFASNNFAIARAEFERVGGFDTSFRGAGGEDREFCSRCQDHGLEFLWLKDAVVLHYHDLSLRRFIRQQFNYGRGAYTYHTARALAGGSGVELEPLNFYSELIRYPRRGERKKPLPFGVTLMLLSQVANAAGYFVEKFFGSPMETLQGGESESTDGAGDGAEQVRLVAREAAGSSLGNVLGMACRYLAMLGATHLLGQELFGDYTLTMAITGVLTTIAVLGLSPGLMPFLSRARAEGEQGDVRAVVRSAYLPVILISLVLTALTAIAAPWASEVLFDKPSLGQFLRPMAGLIALGAISAVTATLLQGYMAVKERVWIEGVLVAATIAAGMGVSWLLGFGAIGAICATLAGLLVGLIAGVWTLARIAPGILSVKLGAASLKVGELLRYSWPLLGSSMLVFLLMWTDVLIMGVYAESAEVGVYGACARIAMLALLAHESLGPVFVARLSDLFARKDWAGISHLYQLTGRWSIWPGLALAWCFAIWGSDLLELFGEGFGTGGAVLAVLCLGKAATSSCGMAGRVLGITGRARLNMVNMLVLVIGNICLNVLWIPLYGAMGAAAATSLCLALVRILQVVEIRWLYGILPFSRQSLVPLVGLGGLAFLVMPWREGHGGEWGWTLPLTGFLLASALLFLLTSFNDDDRAAWRALRARTGSVGGGQS